MNQINITTEYYTGEGSDCELCGWNPDERTFYKVNDEVVWSEGSYGCYGGHRDDGTPLESVISKVREIIEDNNWDEWVFAPSVTEEVKNSHWEITLKSIEHLVEEPSVQLQILKVHLEATFEIVINLEEENTCEDIYE